MTLGHRLRALMFVNIQLERFLMILRAKRDFPSIDIMIVKDNKKSIPGKESPVLFVYGRPESG